MLGSPILDSSLNNCGGNGAAGDLADCYSPKLNDSYRGKTAEVRKYSRNIVGKYSIV